MTFVIRGKKYKKNKYYLHRLTPGLYRNDSIKRPGANLLLNPQWGMKGAYSGQGTYFYFEKQPNLMSVR